MICNTYVQFFKTLADPAKLEIITLLKKRKMTVSAISQHTKFEQSRVSHNLKKLKDLGFVTVKPKGKERIYSINRKTILPLFDLITNHVDKYCRTYCKCKGNAKKERWKIK